jgi:hypothetical protein
MEEEQVLILEFRFTTLTPGDLKDFNEYMQDMAVDWAEYNLHNIFIACRQPQEEGDDE